jgi:hypothetical protein
MLWVPRSFREVLEMFWGMLTAPAPKAPMQPAPVPILARAFCPYCAAARTYQGSALDLQEQKAGLNH